MDNRPIGIFDSGLGGLTAVKEILSILPQEDIVYFGDTGRVPYGTRSKETIMKYAKQDMAFLQSKNVKMIIAACGTVSSVAGHIGEALSLPFTGVLKPTALAACLATHKKRIGIIGTTATIKSGSYQKAILEINPDIQVFAQDCPLFVPLVENGFTSPDSDIVLSVIKHYLQPFMDADIDTLILGCGQRKRNCCPCSRYIGGARVAHQSQPQRYLYILCQRQYRRIYRICQHLFTAKRRTNSRVYRY